MDIKLRKLLAENKKKKEINEALALPPWKLEQIAKEIVEKYFASTTSPARISMTKDGIEQNKMLKDLTSSIKGAIKSVLKNYPKLYKFDDTRDMWKNK
jgi:hypothetical protein